MNRLIGSKHALCVLWTLMLANFGTYPTDSALVPDSRGCLEYSVDIHLRQGGYVFAPAYLSK